VVQLDKYEYNLKIDQMKSLYSEENYEAAAEIADTINWNKVKNVNALVRAGEIYEKVGRYDESREILLTAYDRSPIGRMIIYRLAEVAVKMQDFTAAEEYYREFVEIAPHDNLRYVLRYEIRKAQGADYQELIRILEELKDQEYTEEWAYELAYLYHKANMSEKCIESCDELILWFGDGPYVERALELKMLYQPLSKAQEEKYRRFRLAKEGITSIGEAEMQRAGEYVHDPVEIPQVSLNPERFNTVNLQEEIAKGMQQIIDATEKDTITDTMDSIKKIVEDIPYLQLPKEEQEKTDQPHIETDEEINDSLRTNFQELLGEDYDGQMSFVVNEKAKLEQQITGQMSIEDVLEEWEKTKRAAETALQEAEQRKLESAKARALQEAGDIMDRLNDVIPKLDAGVSPKELLEEEYLQGEHEDASIPQEDMAPQGILLQADPAVTGMPVQAELGAAEMAAEIGADAVSQDFPEELPELQDVESILAEEAQQEVSQDTPEDLSEELPEPQDAESLLAEETPQDTPEDLSEELPELQDAESLLAEEDTQEEPSGWQAAERLLAEEAAREEQDDPREELPEIASPESLGLETFDGGASPDNASAPVDHLTSEQKAIFSYFVPVKGMEEQLCQALTGAADHIRKGGSAGTGNIIIQGGQGCGKTVLATSLIKVLQKETGAIKGRIGKIDASSLNTKDIQTLMRKIAGGCLIIEHAGDLTRESAITLSLLMENDTSGSLVILEDTARGIRKALSLDDGFAKKFSEKITVPIFTNDELVSFARSYAKELGYEIDELAVLALYNRISNIQKLDQETTLTEVKEIVDEAIEREGRIGLKKYFSILTAKRYTDDDCILLQENHFQ
jgi:tetratricopeptide (TPR) repeat protein